jgi:hypothetical protein
MDGNCENNKRYNFVMVDVDLFLDVSYKHVRTVFCTAFLYLANYVALVRAITEGYRRRHGHPER